jgi:Icc protein
VLHRHPQVVAVLCGHAHTPAATTFAGRPLLAAPGVVSTLRFPWEPGDAVLDHDLPPALAYHVIDDDRGVTTHYRAVPTG